MFSAMEGLPTQRKKKEKKKDEEYEVWVTTGDPTEAGSDGLPQFTFYGDDGVFGPHTLFTDHATLTPGSTVNCQVH